MSGQLTDEALFGQYLAGDEPAFEILVHRWTPVLRATMQRAGIPHCDADELVQDVFLHLHRSARDFNAGSLLRPWIVTIALNLRRDYLRRPVRRIRVADAPLDLPDVNASPSRALEQQQDAARVQAALSELTPTQREVVELHWLSELPFREVAKAVGSSAGAVRVRAHRGYERLREALSRST